MLREIHFSTYIKFILKFLCSINTGVVFGRGAPSGPLLVWTKFFPISRGCLKHWGKSYIGAFLWRVTAPNLRIILLVNWSTSNWNTTNVQWNLFPMFGFCENYKVNTYLHRAIAKLPQFLEKVFPSIVFVDHMISFGMDVNIKFYLQFATFQIKDWRVTNK